MKRSVYWIFLLHIILFVHGNKAGASQPYRTAYHFQPPKNWMNGPMYRKGVYHLFYQYNPYAAVWGNISWAHSVSYNLVDWMHLDNAINPTEPYDINGCFSGSATILPGVGKPVILYTGNNFENHQVQNLAVPKNMSDPLLREWVKLDRNPVMAPVNGINPMITPDNGANPMMTSVNDIKPDMFRDPTTAWQGSDKIWRVIIGSQINGHGAAILYKSKDFVSWTRSRNPLHSSVKTGMWECPDFYPVSTRPRIGLHSSFNGRKTKHVLKASFSDHDYYIIGNYDSKTDRYNVDVDFMDSIRQLRYDYGMFYASKTFYDSDKKRRILWGWVTEADSKSDDIEKGWSGIQSIPRTVLLDKKGKQLVQWPIRELEKLRAREVSLHNKEIKGGTVLKISGVTASQADIEVSFQLPNLEGRVELMDTKSVDPQQLCSENNSSVKGVLGPFGLLALASKDLTEQTAIFFRIFKGHDKYVVLMCSDQSRSSLKGEVDKKIFGAFLDVDPTQKISLRTLIDHSMVESFGGEGKACITARVYPELAIDNKSHLYAFNYGTESVRISSLRAWSMKKARMVEFREERNPLIN
ncbi:beta-fructofuranosidase, insoluble isoenzyme CWINV1-like [Olea europaea subsp. europaea]|uniref:Beta-fructofuranosidase, insoluble isoenzyme CWINV1-like n=1 Tax=Olea europaea subsp. europaea TaxID=158383 RepID=A0A8S0P6V4_OLEEU|nr:beta-fructofuranosidase, insoluble isoenzyme CWINV1-like [Olea europaea subsp. europaea]